MGAALAIWAAVECPRLVKGLVLHKVPQIWETRTARRLQLEKEAEGLRSQDPHRAAQLLGASRADLPSREDLRRLEVPVLIVGCRGDTTYPATCSEDLANVLGAFATLVIAENEAVFKDVFVEALASWLERGRFKAPKTAGGRDDSCFLWPVLGTIASAPFTLLGGLVTALVGSSPKALTLFDGTTVPCHPIGRPTAAGKASASTPLLIFGHGMRGPADFYPRILGAANVKLAGQKPSAVPRTILYDARGHGGADGWQRGGAVQHHWRALAVDMLQVAAHYGSAQCGGLVVGGCSKGAATALWATLLCPGLVKALVMYKVPKIWGDRGSRRQKLEERAEFRPQAEADRDLGAAWSDLPEPKEIQQISVPVLLVSSRDDPTHPAQSAEALANLLGPLATLVVVSTKEQLQPAFSAALASFMSRHF